MNTNTLSLVNVTPQTSATPKPVAAPEARVSIASANVSAQEPSRQAPREVESAPEISRGELDKAVERISDFSQNIRRNLQFSIDESTGRTMITVLDATSEEVIRVIPPEKLMAVSERMDEIRGLLFEGKA